MSLAKHAAPRLPAGLSVLPETRINVPFYFEPPVTLGAANIGQNVRIGRHSFLNEGVIREHTTIGRYCSMGRKVTIAAPHHPLHFMSTHLALLAASDQGAPNPDRDQGLRETIVGNDVWIGDNVFIKRGVHIGDGAVIGASAVVTKDVPPYAIMAGVPARLLRYRFDELTRQRLLRTAWWIYPEEFLGALPLRDVEATLDRLEGGAPTSSPVAYTRVPPLG
ncbi:MAG: CatB-related O-acetyltransferase [Alphaproteobacteria bacterium]